MPPTVAIATARPFLRRFVATLLGIETDSIPIFSPHSVLIQDPSSLTNVDVLILDTARVEGAFEAIAAVRQIGRCRVLVVTAAAGDYVSNRAAACGASGMVSELDAMDGWEAAIRTVAKGGVYHSPASVAAREIGPLTAGKLTPKESQILPLACRGLSDEIIGKMVGISSLTAESHRSAIMRKLGVADAGCLMIAGVVMGVAAATEIDYASRVRRSAGGRRRK